MPKFVNLTPHPIVIKTPNRDITIPPQGTVARVAVSQVKVGEIDDIPVVKNTYGDVVGLPDPAPNTVYVVSGLVLSALQGKGRSDVVAPDTGPTAIRDNQGRIIAVTRLVAPSS